MVISYINITIKTFVSWHCFCCIHCIKGNSAETPKRTAQRSRQRFGRGRYLPWNKECAKYIPTPSAVACDKSQFRASAHPPGGFLYRERNFLSIRAKNPTLQDSPLGADRFRGIFLFRRSTPFRWGRPCDNCFLFDRGSEGIFYQIRKNLQNYGWEDGMLMA